MSKKIDNKKIEYMSSSEEDYSSSEDEAEKIKKSMSKILRLREAIKAKQEERKRGTKKYKENVDE